MIIIEIEKLSNGAHRNQSWDCTEIPNGYAIIPADMETPNFPFGDIETAEVDGVVTVTSWTAPPIPEETSESIPNSEKRRLAYSTGEVDGVDYRVEWNDEHYTTDALTQLGLQYRFRGETKTASEIQSIVENEVTIIRVALPD